MTSYLSLLLPSSDITISMSNYLLPTSDFPFPTPDFFTFYLHIYSGNFGVDSRLHELGSNH